MTEDYQYTKRNHLRSIKELIDRFIFLDIYSEGETAAELDKQIRFNFQNYLKY